MHDQYYQCFPSLNIYRTCYELSICSKTAEDKMPGTELVEEQVL